MPFFLISPTRKSYAFAAAAIALGCSCFWFWSFCLPSLRHLDSTFQGGTIFHADTHGRNVSGTEPSARMSTQSAAVDVSGHFAHYHDFAGLDAASTLPLRPIVTRLSVIVICLRCGHQCGDSEPLTSPLMTKVRPMVA